MPEPQPKVGISEGVLFDILRCEVGSTAHGIGIEGQEDLDEMSIALERPEWVLGLREWDTDVIRLDNGMPLGPHDRSTPDTYELTRYSLRKWMRLAVDGNPSILMMLFAPISETTRYGAELRQMTTSILSANCLQRYAGYMRSQALRLVGEKGSGHGKRGGGRREEYVSEYGYDTKYAAHCLRLGYQGLQLAEMGFLSLPMKGKRGDFVRSVRRGEVDFETAFAEMVKTYEELTNPKLKCRLPPQPDLDIVNKFMIETYQHAWSTNE